MVGGFGRYGRLQGDGDPTEHLVPHDRGGAPAAACLGVDARRRGLQARQCQWAGRCQRLAPIVWAVRSRPIGRTLWEVLSCRGLGRRRGGGGLMPTPPISPYTP